MMTADELVAFEADIAETFNKGLIRAPVHLAAGNEGALLEIFKKIRPQDWIAVTWRSHYHCLLKGVPPERLKADIVAGRSITLAYPEHRIISSAIVGGALPIALGLALSIKRGGRNERVYCFVGDMTAATGIAHECAQYAGGHELPLTIIVEDNGLSVCTQTARVWGYNPDIDSVADVRYDYRLPFPHAGAGKRVQF